jgi:hypothetical protein
MPTFANHRREIFADELAKDESTVVGGVAVIEAIRASGGVLWLTATGVAHDGLSAAQIALVRDHEAEIIDLLRLEAQQAISLGLGCRVDSGLENPPVRSLTRQERSPGFGIPMMTNLRVASRFL